MIIEMILAVRTMLNRNIWENEVIIIYIKILSQHSSEWTEERDQNP